MYETVGLAPTQEAVLAGRGGDEVGGADALLESDGSGAKDGERALDGGSQRVLGISRGTLMQ